MSPLYPCPVCHSQSWITVRRKRSVSAENRLRNRFVFSRMDRHASRTELKDLTDFMHGFAAPLKACTRCGSLVRAERHLLDSQAYAEDPNDRDLMSHLFPRYVQAFRDKEPGYRQLLPPKADVLELGSHLGGFLQTAEEWNWNPIGLDVGTDTSDFVKSKGFTVWSQEIEDAGLKPRSMDAAFVWNCFEQIPDPASTLREITAALRGGGLLVIRVPNAWFYREKSFGLPRAIKWLGWNNLLGFPYLHGYTQELVTRIVRPCGFEYFRGFNSKLLTMPFPDFSAQLANEQADIDARIAHWSDAKTRETGQLAGPWIEMVYRKMNYE